MKIPSLEKLKKKYSPFLAWPLLVVYYYAFRFIAGLSYGAIYGFIVLLLLLRTSFEQIALIFFFLSLIAYIFGHATEANHYLSFVFGFLFLSLIKYIYQMLHRK